MTTQARTDAVILQVKPKTKLDWKVLLTLLEIVRCATNEQRKTLLFEIEPIIQRWRADD